jgi:two-component SAPR family response regulator
MTAATHNKFAWRTEMTTEDQPLRGARILVAEDDAILAFDMVSQLQKAGAEVLGPAMTLAHTLDFAKAVLLICAVLDVNLGRETVFPAAQVLKERGVSIVFYTGYNKPEALRREWPEAQVLIKPASPEVLIRTLCEACRGIVS